MHSCVLHKNTNTHNVHIRECKYSHTLTGAADGKGKKGGGSGSTALELAPGALARVHVGVLRCLGGVCANADAQGAVKGWVWGIAQVRRIVVSSSSAG